MPDPTYNAKLVEKAREIAGVHYSNLGSDQTREALDKAPLTVAIVAALHEATKNERQRRTELQEALAELQSDYCDFVCSDLPDADHMHECEKASALLAGKAPSPLASANALNERLGKFVQGCAERIREDEIDYLQEEARTLVALLPGKA